ncbi:protein-tyrosine phosphatase-like protein [Podospora didyma]|uniref:protein-tyrosine-phosphatase n=1 Tax=Podospora didyma TaxID=330526 RepID=A0AAE0U007_9PEZI|nr:protein-tyrosine phosphatase-like protein [Podospora didyma]
MWVTRIKGEEELFVGGIFGLNKASLLEQTKVTHILSVIKYSLNPDEDAFRNVEHLSVDLDDMEDVDILVHLPKMVRFIERGLYPDGSKEPSGAVLVHCHMGKSRSVSAIIAYLLWKHPHRFGRSDPATKASEAVAQALQWVRETRPIAEPNDGFMRQLEIYWEMGCPANSDDAVEKEPAYQRWLYRREVDDAARIGRAPDWIRFEDEEAEKEGGAGTGTGIGADAGKEKAGDDGMELRCKKCRRVLATKPFVIPHQGRGSSERPDCPHFFIEALSWMRPTLEEGVLEGRLMCPQAKCGASIGRYAWQGFKCSCGDWVAPAFSLQKSKVDEIIINARPDGGATAMAARMASLGIRMPPGPSARRLKAVDPAAKESGAADISGGRKENL